MTYSQADFQAALSALRRGGVILYPTDTVWGIGCDATSQEAVERIFRIKRRADSKAMLSLIDSAESLMRYVDTAAVEAAAAVIDPVRPTTVIYPGVTGISPGLIAPDGTAGFRISRADFSRDLCHELGHPLVSTSANISGHPAPASFSDIDSQILEAVDYVVIHDRDADVDAAPSRIVTLNPDGTSTVIRP
ncbi:MAG: Sua5/YciO/YrdC/YwlC family protein [Barnesiella sp.]|nr:Sua5/YciO/YrdC/YwlC family protein [Barnesiella sp.]